MCCGQPQTHKRKTVQQLPPNPEVSNGVHLLYLGAGSITYVGSASALKFHVSPHRRDFFVPKEDVASLLERRNVILSPR